MLSPSASPHQPGPPHSVPTAFPLIVLSTPLALCSSIHKHEEACHWPITPSPRHRELDGTLQSLSCIHHLPVSLSLCPFPSASLSVSHLLSPPPLLILSSSLLNPASLWVFLSVPLCLTSSSVVRSLCSPVSLHFLVFLFPSHQSAV